MDSTPPLSSNIVLETETRANNKALSESPHTAFCRESLDLLIKNFRNVTCRSQTSTSSPSRVITQSNFLLSLGFARLFE